MKPIFLLAVAVAALGFFGLALRDYFRKKRFFAAPFPQNWEKILQRNLPVYSAFSERERQKLHFRIKEFLSEKTFEACGGLKTVTDEMAVTVAAHASLLSVNRPGPAWQTLQSVLIYPRAFSAPNEESEIDGGLVERERGKRDGESWSHGSIVLSWQRITRDIALHGNGQNVIIHEFAHRLDADDGITGGRPPFDSAEDARAWQIVAAREIERLRAGDTGTVIDEYGAENPAEFFATSVEAFFEKPEAMRSAHPELYTLLEKLFRP